MTEGAALEYGLVNARLMREGAARDVRRRAAAHRETAAALDALAEAFEEMNRLQALWFDSGDSALTRDRGLWARLHAAQAELDVAIGRVRATAAAAAAV